MPHSENWTGNGSGGPSIIPPKAGPVGAKGQAISSTPEACVLGFHHPFWPQGHGLLVRQDPLKLQTEILEVIRADAEFKHFLDHRQEVR